MLGFHEQQVFMLERLMLRVCHVFNRIGTFWKQPVIQQRWGEKRSKFFKILIFFNPHISYLMNISGLSISADAGNLNCFLLPSYILQML